MAIGVDDARPVQGTAVRTVGLGWFLRRSLIGIAILLVAMGGLAWLTYASIDPDPEDDAAAKAHHETTVRLVPVEL